MGQVPDCARLSFFPHAQPPSNSHTQSVWLAMMIRHWGGLASIAAAQGITLKHARSAPIAPHPTPHNPPCLPRRNVSPGMSADAFESVAEQMLVVLSHYFQLLPLRRGAPLAPERFRESPSKARWARCAAPAARLAGLLHAAAMGHGHEAGAVCAGRATAAAEPSNAYGVQIGPIRPSSSPL